MRFIRPFFLLISVLFCISAFTQSNLCNGSLGDPIVDITFGSGDNPGQPLSSIVPQASTTYSFVSVFGKPANPIPVDGSYTITNNVPANTNWFEGATDHTGDANGYMAFFNANPTPGEFYKQTVSNLCPGTSYQFSAWIANVLDPSKLMGVLPDVTFRIEKTDGTLVASYKTGGIAQSSAITWLQYGFYFTTPSDGTSLVLKMINTNVGGNALPGNDFAVDDITFRACTAQLTASFSSSALQNTLDICPNKSFTLYGDANPFSNDYEYLWQSSSDQGITWNDIPNSNKITITITSPAQSGVTVLYRMLSSKTGNINSQNCRGSSNLTTLTTSVCTVVTAGFTVPDTVCVNTSFQINNTTTGATTSYWNFCSPNLSEKPTNVNLGNLNYKFNIPVYTDYVQVNGNYYMFVVNNNDYGGLVRLDYGNSMLNTPTVVSLSSLLSAFNGGTAEGFQLVQLNGHWLGIIVGGDSKNNYTSFIAKLDFGADITNINPVVTFWGNVGNLSYPHELYLFKDKATWYGYTTSTYSSELIRYNFGSDFSATPVATDLGTLNGNLLYPVGLYDYIKNGNHYLFVTNAGTNGGPNSSLVRLDYGNSLLNTPSIHNLGNLGGKYLAPYDFTTVENCSQLTGMALNTDNTIARFSFPGADITAMPVFSDTVHLDNASFLHSFSKIYREGSDAYFFIPNAANNTLSRIKIPGCNNASRAGTSNTNPGTISYNAPGTYTISLIADEELQTQATVCKNVVILAQPIQQPSKDTSFCEGKSIMLVSSFSNGIYLWNTGATDSAIMVSQPGTYWVQINNGVDCGATDSFTVTTNSNPVVNLGKDTGLCANETLLINAGNTGSSYVWQDGSTKSTYMATKGGSFSVTVTNANKCSAKDTITIANYPSPVLSSLNDAKICDGNSAQLSVTANGTGNIYSWSPASTLNNPSVANPVAKPIDTTNYTVTVTNATGCISKDTATVFVLAKPLVSSIKDTSICSGNSVVLQTSASNSLAYSWSPSSGLDNTNTISPKASPAVTTSYIITAKNDGCSVTDTVNVTILSLPNIMAGNDTVVCGTGSIPLFASGGNQYQWSPATGLSNSNIFNPVAVINHSIIYTVTGTDKNGCVNKDSVQVTNRSVPQFLAAASLSSVCAGDSVLLTAHGGDMYMWQPAETVLHPADSSTYAVPVASTNYTVQIGSTQCKTGNTQEVSVAVNSNPQVSIAKSNDITCRDKTATLTASGGNYFNWSPAGINDSSHTATITVMPEATTIYKVTTSTDSNCTATDTVTVKVNNNLANQYPIASAFSPNGDGINDCFGIKSWDILKVDFQIYDQWGWRVFYSTDPSNVCWDGRYNGKNQLQGTYVYNIYAVTSCGIINKAGTVVLIKETH